MRWPTAERRLAKSPRFMKTMTIGPGNNVAVSRCSPCSWRQPVCAIRFRLMPPITMPARLPNVSKPGGETGGVEWTAVNETERRNRLPFNRLEPEAQRHQPLGKRVGSEFESLPPSHSLCSIPSLSIAASCLVRFQLLLLCG